MSKQLSMKRKINLQLLGVAAIAIITTLIMAISFFYDVFEHEILIELKNDSYILKMSNMFEGEMEAAHQLENLRVTVIAQDGSVKYDNWADKAQMGNHGGRPEVIAAFKEGEGLSIRRSATLGKNTFYYAVKQADGTVLRIAKDADSIWSIFRNATPMIIGIVCFLFAICIIIARLLTKSLVAPIGEIASNIEACGSISTYKELVPFISTIQEQHEDILKSAKMRQEFTANVSHELKTPLTSISGYAELIENGMADENEMRRFAKEIHRSSNRLLNLINDIIKLSELDATDIRADFESVNLYEVARESVEMLSLNAEKHEISVKLEGENCFVQGNKSMLEEVVYNLCDNAIRYNNKGGKVTVTVSVEGHEAVVAVKDTGIGISQKNQGRIFERFYRVDKSRSKLTGGTGLGLAIVKHIVAQHGASLEVESEVGKGTEIKIYFQLQSG